MSTSIRIVTAFLILISLGFTSSRNASTLSQPEPYLVTIHLLGNPDMVNPICNQGMASTALLKLVYQRLCDLDYHTGKMVPILATDAPKIEEVNDSTLHVSYELRKDAKWDNGDPITVDDVLFTWKVVMNPSVDALSKRYYAKRIRDIILDPQNSQRITFVTERHTRAPYTTCAEFPIIPAYAFDKDNELEDISYTEIVTSSDSHKDVLESFAEKFNRTYSRHSDVSERTVCGSGAYEFIEWKDNIRIILRKKKKWWGAKHKNENCFFSAKPDEIRYQLIKDQTAAVVALKGGKIDVMRGIRSKDFLDMRDGNMFAGPVDLDLRDEEMLAYSYVGINCQHPYLKDKRTRQALAHLFDSRMFIDDVNFGFGRPLIGTVLPSNEKFYNKNIQQRSVDFEKAKALLAEAGWEDSDSDGILDMEIDGERQQFLIEMTFNYGNDERKSALKMFGEQCKKVGIKTRLVGQEWSIFIDKQVEHDFMLCIGAWIMELAPDDPSYLFHSKSANNGSNYPGWSTPRSDELIELINITIDEDERAKLWYEFQEIMHDEVPYIFVSVPRNKLAFSKRVNAHTSNIYPGFWAGDL